MGLTHAPADAPAVAVSRLQLPVYRLRLRKQPYYARGRHGGSGREGWTSSWEIDESDLLGGERSVQTWLHAIRGNSPADATRLSVLYWSIRAVGGTHPDRPFDIDEVPASRQLDVRRYIAMFEILADATWCLGCRSAPACSDDRGLCHWCERAPIGRVFRGARD
jgi:hypothetical protein